MHRSFCLIILLFLSGLSLIGTTQAQDSASLVLDVYLSKTGGRQLWEKTSALRTEGVYAEMNGGYHQVVAQDAPQQFIFIWYRDGRMLMSSKSAGEDALINKQCIFDGQFTFLQVQGHDTISAVSNAHSMTEARRVYGRFCPQVYLLDTQEEVDITYAGKESIDGQVYFIVAFEDETKTSLWYINEQTGFLYIMGDLASGNYTLLSDYREVNGKWLAFKEQTYQNRKLIYNKVIQKASFDVEEMLCEDVSFGQ